MLTMAPPILSLSASVNMKLGTRTVASAPFTERMEVEIVNSSGQIVLTKSLSEETNNVDISRLDSGIYFVKVMVDGKLGVQKLVVE